VALLCDKGGRNIVARFLFLRKLQGSRGKPVCITRRAGPQARNLMYRASIETDVLLVQPGGLLEAARTMLMVNP